MTVTLFGDGAPSGASGRSWQEVVEAAAGCRACPLWKPATQTVFGEGPVPSEVMLVG